MNMKMKDTEALKLSNSVSRSKQFKTETETACRKQSIDERIFRKKRVSSKTRWTKLRIQL